MTCKDCVHYEVCDDIERLMLTVNENLELIYQNGVENSCLYFKNKADFVEVVKVAEILNDAFGNDSPCNYKSMDEWLPYLCEYGNTCDCSYVKCWEQLIKHYDERRADNG